MVCCVTGHRPQGFPFVRDLEESSYKAYNAMLYREIKKIVMKGCVHFITGMANGADMDFASNVLLLRDTEGIDLCLEAALPYALRDSKAINRERRAVLEKCDIKHEVSPVYFNGCMQKRNRYMVDKADVILAIWNGEQRGGTWDTIRYAQRRRKEIHYIMLKDFLK